MLGETVSTVKRASFLLALYIFSMLAVAAPAAAQNPTPTAAISVTCAPSNINVEVKPGSTYSGFTTCTATNPTAYQEKISINVQADGLATAAPGDMYVGAGDSVDFQVSVRATSIHANGCQNTISICNCARNQWFPTGELCFIKQQHDCQRYAILTCPSRGYRAIRSTNA